MRVLPLSLAAGLGPMVMGVLILVAYFHLSPLQNPGAVLRNGICAVMIAFVFFPGLLLLAYLEHRNTYYRVTRDAIEITGGIFRKKTERIPLLEIEVHYFKHRGGLGSILLEQPSPGGLAFNLQKEYLQGYRRGRVPRKILFVKNHAEVYRFLLSARKFK